MPKSGCSPTLAFVKRTVLLAVACVAVALAAAGSAPAAIVPQQGIGGVRLGMSKQAVRATLGGPTKVRRGSSEIGTYTTFVYAALEVTFFAGAKATSIATRSAAERTAGGVGVGSSAADVVARVAGAKCVRDGTYRHCYVGTWLPGKRVSDFTIRNGRVSRITIGYVID